MYRKLASVVLVASALQAKYAFALGLGEMTMHSALNEPLDAEIQLNNTGDLDKTQILVSLGTQKQFEDAGIDRTFFLSNIKFVVTTDGNGNGVVKLSSHKRLNEPFLDFLVEAKWPTGRVLRSYTALVDLPVYTEAAKETVSLGANPQAQTSEPEVTYQPAPATTTPTAPAVSSPATSSAPVASEDNTAENADDSVNVPEPAEIEPAKQKPIEEANAEPAEEAYAETVEPVAEESYESSYQEPVAEVSYEASYDSGFDGETYTVQRNDTLWEIAQQMRPSSAMSIQQVMLAIQRYNDSAFIGGNINRLKAGAELSLPTAEMIRELSAREAISEVREQNQQWRGAQLDATSSSERSYAAYEDSEDGHLSLSSAGAGVANGSDESAELRNQLNAAEDQLATSERENQELSGKVGSLNSQVEKLERMLEIKEAELAQLQQKLGEEASVSEEAQALEAAIEEDKAALEAAEQEAEKQAAAEDVDAVDQKASGTDEPLEVVASADDKQDAEAEAEQEPEVGEEAEPKAAEASMLDKALANPMYLGGVAILIVALVAFILLRRKSKAEQQAFDEFEHFEFDTDEQTAEQASELAEETLAEVAETEQTPEEPEAVDTLDVAEEASEGIELDLDDGDDDQPTTVQTGDAIGEAEIYIAYGRFEQAADLLTGAIAQAPNDVALRSKLLEVYVESQNKAGFQEQFVALQGLGADDAITQAKELLTSQDGVADWLDDLPATSGSQQAPAAAADSDDDFEDLDLDFDDGAADIDPQDVTMVRDGISLRGFDEEEEVSLDADTLDLDAGLEAEDDTEISLDDLDDLETAEQASSEESLDIDLDLSEEAEIEDLAAGDLDLDVSLDGFDDVEESVDSVESTDDAGEIDLSAEFEDEIELDSVVDDVAETEEEISLDLDDDLSLDLSSIDLDGDMAEEPEELSVEADASDELDLGDLDLGLDSSAELELDTEESLDDLDLSLGEEVDLSSDIEPLDEPVEEVDTSDLSLDADLDVELEEEVDLDLSDLDEPELEAALETEEVQEEVAEPEAVEEAPEPVAPAAAVEAPADDSPLATLEGEDLEFLSDADEISTKLDLARAYVEMGDLDGAKDILDEVLAEGNESQKSEANAMLEGLD
jgi:pilus assembly protein FimV